MAFKSAVKKVQGILGLCWDDAFALVDGIHYQDRWDFILEIQEIRDEIPEMDDQELCEVIDGLLT